MPPTTPIASTYWTNTSPKAEFEERAPVHNTRRHPSSTLLPPDQQGRGLDSVNTGQTPGLPPPPSASTVMQHPQSRWITETPEPHQTAPIKTPVILLLVLLVFFLGFILLVSTCSKAGIANKIRKLPWDRFRSRLLQRAKTRPGPAQGGLRVGWPDCGNNSRQPPNPPMPRLSMAGERRLENLNITSSGGQARAGLGLLASDPSPFCLDIRPTRPADYATPAVSSFQQSVKAEKVDTISANTPSGSTVFELGYTERAPPSPTKNGDKHSSVIECGTLRGSDTSRSTRPTSEFDMKSIDLSSLSSAPDFSRDVGIDKGGVEKGDEDPEMAFEVAQAHAQIIKIKKGVLLSWGPKQAPPNTSDAAVALSAPSSPFVIIISDASPALPGPSSSNISVDLGDFPLPPLILNCGTFGSLSQEMPEIFYTRSTPT